MICLIDRSGWQGEPARLYEEIEFPAPPPDRPYIFTNTVTTLDGKLILGEVGSTAAGLGSEIDRLLMHRIEARADAVIIGGSTLRADKHMNYPPNLYRAVVSTSGDLPTDHDFFRKCADGRALVFAPSHLPPDRKLALERVATVHLVGETRVVIPDIVRILHTNYEVRYLLVEGGGSLNFYFFEAGLVDEIFLTLAPRVKGGGHLPTMVDGAGLPREQVPYYELISAYLNGSELFLRYRRRP
ncbi:MAG: dihydrofolate reductase family protein [Fimbriimonadales bacterium]|nr:dihydrofolate reductase family protein [Fimbriimonadales bacterium]